ncbi:probable differentially expressed in FDCP 8 homolog at C-terminar half [Coccomyxa sp. Obi]|nr:probable differentially expressed in FDCP 8 homolog at C-terminar half [Coccomyxa sp. Obi]
MAEDLTQELANAVKKCLTHHTENGQIDLDIGQAFTNAVLKFTEAAQDGSLAFLVSKVRTQPQVYSAYLSSAPMRSKHASAEFEAAIAPLKGAVTFAELLAATADRKASAASSSSNAMVTIEARDAAPHTANHQQHSSAEETRNESKVGPEEEQPPSPELSGMWEAQWSHSPLKAAGSAASHGASVSTAGMRAAGQHQASTGSNSGSDAGHISIGSTAPQSTSSAHQQDSKQDLVSVRWEVDEASSEGGPLVRIYVTAQGQQPGSSMRHSVQARLAQQLDNVMQSQASAAAMSGIQSLAGLLKPPHWARQGPIPAPVSGGGGSTAAPLPAQNRRATDELTGPACAGSNAGPRADASLQLVAVHISVSEAEGEPDMTDQPCRVTLRTTEDASIAAAEPQPSGSGGRLTALSGLFRSSRATSHPSQHNVGTKQSLQDAQHRSEAMPAEEFVSSSQAVSAAPLPLDPIEAPSAGQPRHNPAWAVAGAIGSLYGFVSHAADSAVRPVQQVSTKEATAPLSNRGSVASTSAGDPAHLHSARSPKAPPTPSKQEEAEAAAAEELVLRLKTAASAVLQAGVGPGADILGPDDPDLETVCSGVEALLRHGLRPATPREGWTHYLPGRRSGPIDMLQEAQRLATVEDGKGWGVEDIEAFAGGHNSEAAVQMWIRSSLNERALGSRLRALANTHSLMQSWYSRGAVLRQEEAAGQLLGLLMGLDAVRVLLPVETDSAEQRITGPIGFLAGMTNFLPGRHSNAAGMNSLRGPEVPHVTSPKMRKRTRAVTIGEAIEEPRPTSAAAASTDKSPAPSELVTSSLGALLLSPMSSTDISAEPLSPSTTAAFQALRARHLAGLHQQRSLEEQAAGLDLLSQLLQQQGLSPGPPAPDLAALRSTAAAEQFLGEPANSADTAESGPAEDSAPELAAFLDDLLATPEDSMFAPQLAGEPLQFSSDPGKDPPPWQPLKPVQARVPSIPESAPSKTHEPPADKASSSPFLVAQQTDSYNSAEERRKAAEAAAAASEKARSRLSRGRGASRGIEPQMAPGVAVQGQHDDRSALSPAASASTMLGARSQEGDFYRLLDSEEPAPRRSFHLDKDEQLPRSFSIAARGGESQASGTAQQTAEDGEAVLETDAGTQEDDYAATRVDGQETSADALPAMSDADTSAQIGTDASAKSAHDPGPCDDGGREEHPSKAEASQEESIHGGVPKDDLDTASAQAADRLAQQNQLEEISGERELGLARQEPSADLSYSDLTALLSSSKGDADEPDEASSTGGDHEEVVIHEFARERSQPSSTTADYDGSSARDAAAPSQSGGHEPEQTKPADTPVTQQMISELQPHPPAAPHPSDQHTEGVEPPAAGPRGAVSAETAAEDGSTGQQMSRPDSHADDTERPALLAPPDDRAHITPPSTARKAAQLHDAADLGAGSHSPAHQQSSVAPEIREFLASQGLQHILEGEQMDLPASQGEDLGDPLSPREHGSLTDANLLEDMNDILMLDMGGLGAFRTPLGSPPRSGSAHFSFDDPHQPPRPPDTDPLPPTWRVAEARVVSAMTVTEAGAEYTRYSVEVTPADGDEAWTVHHRFSDFLALRKALTALAGAGSLPQCWADVSKARSVTGRHRLAPEVVAARQAMLDRCLVSVISTGPPLSEAPPLLAFLAPADPHWEPPSQHRPGVASPGLAGAAAAQLTRAGSGPASSASSSAEAGNRYGSLVRLLTEEPPKLAEADLIRMQRGQCAACRAPLPPPAKPSGFLGSRSAATGPRRCEYNARLYCHECHKGDLAELPALVLHHWDFQPRPVSTLAADYLASIADRPLLCIGAVNPGLYARVPMLARAQDLRTRACKALAATRASGPEGAAKAKRLLAGAGPRRYLLESPDFWAMRELVELSKGAFSRLPAWLEAAAARAATLATSALLTAAAEQQRPR